MQALALQHALGRRGVGGRQVLEHLARDDRALRPQVVDAAVAHERVQPGGRAILRHAACAMDAQPGLLEHVVRIDPAAVQQARRVGPQARMVLLVQPGNPHPPLQRAVVADVPDQGVIDTMRSIGSRARSAMWSGTLTAGRRSRSASRSLGSVIIFM